jgi:hypothetical protein
MGSAVFKSDRVFRLLIAILALAGTASMLSPVNSAAQTPVEGQRKQMRAVRIDGVPSPRLDGRLDDEAWQRAEFVSDFLQKEPDQGAAPTESTKVAILYDDHAIYVGARMYSDHPENIRVDVNRRDQPGNAEMIILSLDTYLDRRTSYDFCVSASGVRMDRYHAEDQEHETDYSYDVVWEGDAHIDSEGWSAEMRIPFSQLRFNNQDKQIWGINWNRWVPARNEDVFWIYTPREETGWSSRFGDLVGIEGIQPSRRLELLPYFAGEGRMVDRDPGDPFDNDPVPQIGGDLKMGLGPNLTLDATINPDFGQVEADPAEVNLTAFETSFSERRPFFIEGSQLLEADGAEYYYSRRIGAEPHGDARDDGDFVKSPHRTTIPAAAKITGRLHSGLSVGALLAVTGRERATVYDHSLNSYSKAVVEPPAGYGVMRLQQEFGDEASTVGLILTGVQRDLTDGGPLVSDLRKQAFTGGTDWKLRFQDGTYELNGSLGFSHVRGSADAILGTQLSSARYFQRPDADYVTLDSSRTSLTGYQADLELSKQAGKHWLWEAGFGVESPEFEINDMGILNTADDIDAWGVLRYRETQPGSIFRNYSIGINPYAGWNFGGIRQYSGVGTSWDMQFTNFNRASTWFEYSFSDQSDNFTRGGPTMKTSSSWNTGLWLGNNFTARTQYSGEFWYARNELDGWGIGLDGSISTRGRRWQVVLDPQYERSETARQYITTVDDAGGGEQTYGARYIFSRLDRSTLSMQLRVNYFFTPDLSLEVYGEPFAASGRFFDFGELIRAGDNGLRYYGTDGTTFEKTDEGYQVTDGPETFAVDRDDFGELSFRSNVVLRWEFRPGSTLYLVWQQNRSGQDAPGRFVRPRSLWDSFGASGENFFAVKISYWVPVS